MRPESANPETPDEIIAMITFAGSPELQEQLRSLCREFINIFSTSVPSLPVQVDPMVIEIDRAMWGVRAIASHLDTILLKSKQPSARRSTNCWSSASSRNLRPVSGAKLTPYLKAIDPQWRLNQAQWRLTLDFVQLNAATKVVYSKHTRNINAVRYYETHLLRSP